MNYKKILDELTVRFLLNLPPQDQTLVRLFFILEEAHWFYLDFISPDKLSLRQFIADILSHNQIYMDIDKSLKIFMEYKYSVPVYGALIFNDKMDYVLLNKGCSRKSQFLFPRGKKCYNETEAQTAIREVYEEIGYDITNKIGRIVFKPSKEKYTLFMVYNVRLDEKFMTATRNEISEIKWVSVKDILCQQEYAQARIVYMKIKKRIDRIKANRFKFDKKKVLQEFDRIIKLYSWLKNRSLHMHTVCNNKRASPDSILWKHKYAALLYPGAFPLSVSKILNFIPSIFHSKFFVKKCFLFYLIAIITFYFLI